MKFTKQEIKKTAQAALKSEYGFAPPLSEITLLEASDDRTYILFSVRNKEYRFTSYILTYGDIESVWVGDGTITRV